MSKPWYSIEAKANDSADVWVYEQVGEDWFGEGVTAKAFCRDLAALKVASINLHINSPGGSVWDGQAIYNALRNHPASVTAYVDGLAASIASVIAMAGDTIVMASNALMMVHNPYGGCMGTADDMRHTADVLDKVRDTIVGVYCERCGNSTDAIGELMDAETWLTADEAVALGLADEVGSEMQVAACADISSMPYRNAPEALLVAAPEQEPEPITEPEEAAGAADDSPEPAGAATPVVDFQLERIRARKG